VEPKTAPSEAAKDVIERELATVFRAVVYRVSYIPFRHKMPADAFQRMVLLYLWDTYWPGLDDKDRAKWLDVGLDKLDRFRTQPEFKEIGHECESAFDKVAKERETGSFKDLIRDPHFQWRLFQRAQRLGDAIDPKVAEKMVSSLIDRMAPRLSTRAEAGAKYLVLDAGAMGALTSALNEAKQLTEGGEVLDVEFDVDTGDSGEAPVSGEG
jgi:hypothetical protein